MRLPPFLKHTYPCMNSSHAPAAEQWAQARAQGLPGVQAPFLLHHLAAVLQPVYMPQAKISLRNWRTLVSPKCLLRTPEMLRSAGTQFARDLFALRHGFAGCDVHIVLKSDNCFCTSRAKRAWVFTFAGGGGFAGDGFTGGGEAAGAAAAAAAGAS